MYWLRVDCSLAGCGVKLSAAKSSGEDASAMGALLSGSNLIQVPHGLYNTEQPPFCPSQWVVLDRRSLLRFVVLVVVVVRHSSEAQRS
jgi:hypothetical protein